MDGRGLIRGAAKKMPRENTSGVAGGELQIIPSAEIPSGRHSFPARFTIGNTLQGIDTALVIDVP